MHTGRCNADETRQIVRAESGRLRCHLTRPYQLSFATLEYFDSCWIRLWDDAGRNGVGEAVALPGYSWETADEIEQLLQQLADQAPGLRHSEFQDRCAAERQAAPFATSAAMTALELPLLIPQMRGLKKFSLNWPLAASNDRKAFANSACSGFRAGYRHIKLKVGSRLEWDLATAEQLLTTFEGERFSVVFDANQAYTRDEALLFARKLESLDSERVAWLEQPLARTDWDGCEALCRQTRIPIVLDESIYDEADVERASGIGARGVKLKLFKHFGPRHSLALARFARELGLQVAFGNGVATDIGNLAEYAVLHVGEGLFAEPSESSGFQKLRQPVLFAGLQASQGRMACTHEPGEIASLCAHLRPSSPPEFTRRSK